MPQAKSLPSYEQYSDQQKAVIARIGPLFRDAADRHVRGQLRRQGGEEVATLRPADSPYSVHAWSESACNYVQNHFKPAPSSAPTAKMAAPRQRARKWTDMWAEEHVDELHARLKALGQGDGLKARNIALRELTEDVAEDEKARYREAARQHKDSDGLTTTQQIKNRKELLKYAKSVAGTLNTNYGIPFAVLLTGYKDEEGEWSVTALENNDIIDPRVSAMSKAKDKEFNTMLTLWQKYVQEMADAVEPDDNGSVAGGATVAKVADSTGRDMPLLALDASGHCVIPSDGDIAKMDAKDLSRALREVWTAEYVLASGLPSASVPWVDIRAQPHKYFDVDRMWLEGVPVEDPSHIRRRSLVALLQQYRGRGDHFLRFTGVQRNGELVDTNLYPSQPVIPTEPLSAGGRSARRPEKSKMSGQGKNAKGKRRAREASSEESEAVFTDDEELSVNDILKHGKIGPKPKTAATPAGPTGRRHPAARVSTSTQLVEIEDGLLALSDYADQPPDQFRSQRERHIKYVKALAPDDRRLQAAADHAFGFRDTTLEDIKYPSLKMLPWATWHYDLLQLPSPRIFDYPAMWSWLDKRGYITGDVFYNKAGQLEQLTLGLAMLLRELHTHAFDRSSPSDDVIERESILPPDMNINSATDIIHNVLEFILSISPPPSNNPVGSAGHPSLSVFPPPSEDALASSAGNEKAIVAEGSTGTDIRNSPGPVLDGAVSATPNTDPVQAAEAEETVTDNLEPSEAALRKRKRAETGPSGGNPSNSGSSSGGTKAVSKPPSKVAKGHEFAEKVTRSGRQVTVSERARGSVVLK
ncbi:hypothetical protein BDW22DRAFT_1425206 [Trametopsis cervina]|nr:hypothetical protein BDW22DRAFT_1425206 [Trametopsis cervina]